MKKINKPSNDTQKISITNKIKGQVGVTSVREETFNNEGHLQCQMQKEVIMDVASWTYSKKQKQTTHDLQKRSFSDRGQKPEMGLC